VLFRRGLPEVLEIATGDFMPNAGSLFLENPIRAVTLIGHEPVSLFSGMTWENGGRWLGVSDWSGPRIPTALFRRLPVPVQRSVDQRLLVGTTSMWRQYPTRAPALTALCEAAVRYGEEKARELEDRLALRDDED